MPVLSILQELENAMDRKFTILSYLATREEPLSYYEIDRQLNANNLHAHLPLLPDTLEQLLQEGLITKMLTHGGKLYSLSEMGRATYDDLKNHI
jgi:DNA-binding PadR family transcriptional regulator